MNLVILIGNLGSDPELKYTANNRAVCNFSVATNKRWTDSNGVKKEKVEWHRIVVWGDQAEACAKYLSKGKMVNVQGENSTRTWEKDGQKHWITEVVANRVTFLSPMKSKNQNDGVPLPSDEDMDSNPNQEENPL